MLRKGSTQERVALGDQFALFVSSVVDYAIFMLDPAGNVVTWNEGAQRIKGYKADEIIGRHFSLFYPVEDARNRKPDWELEVARREGHYAEEGWRIRKDGTRFWASVVITAVRDETGRLRAFGKVTRDLTDRRKQDARRHAEREAEAQRLRDHAASVAELERAKTEFLNLASHELRGPLTVIRGYNSMLEDGSIPPDQVPAVARLLEAKLAQMDLLIEQMLETARLEHNRLELSSEKFDVRWAVQEQLDIFRPLFQGHHFVMKAAHEPLLVEGDRTRIATIVANLTARRTSSSPTGRRGKWARTVAHRDLLAQEEPEAGARDAHILLRGQAAEASEKNRLVLGRDPEPFVADTDEDVSAEAAGRDADLTAAGRVLQGVGTSPSSRAPAPEANSR